MHITKLRVKNYRGLRDVSIPMSNFGCLIGENNAGKSSVLQALSLFFSGTKLTAHNFFDAAEPIRIELCFAEIGDDDLQRLASEEHRSRIRELVSGSNLTLARVYDTEGKGSLKVAKLVPLDERYNPSSVSELLKGKRAGAPLAAALVSAFPELDSRVTPSTSSADARALIEQLAGELPDNEKTLCDVDLPTGFDKTIMPMLPEPIYIPAVKDLADDIKTTESASFGKLLGILFRAIEPQLGEAQDLFEKLHGQLNRIVGPDGTVSDGRLAEVRQIEGTVQRYLRESFPTVTLQFNIPPPRLQAVLSSAQIVADDGTAGSIETKGDGLKRSVTFSILRAYVDLGKAGAFAGDESDGEVEERGRYLLLFEEPELYLYPKAQLLLFDALRTFAERHAVLVTTHSPLFFGPHATATFTKLRKTSGDGGAAKPFTVAHPVDLSDVEAKDQFQLICHENNNIAFFSNTVVLVEGDSDLMLFPHIARTLNPDWDCAKTPVAIARINGKSSIRRYARFFSHFRMRVAVIADLDLLVKDFDQVDVPEEVRQKRDRLIQATDAYVAGLGPTPEPSASRIGNAHRSGSLREQWRQVRLARGEYDAGRVEWAAVEAAAEEFFAWERHDIRLETLKYATDPELVKQKRELLATLRQHDVYVLERGDIEAYYPEAVTGRDKPSKAQDFCIKHATREDVLAICPIIGVDALEQPQHEFAMIFGRIFGGSAEPLAP